MIQSKKDREIERENEIGIGIKSKLVDSKFSNKRFKSYLLKPNNNLVDARNFGYNITAII